MISILRSNQPIAWFIVPVTAMAWIAAALWFTERDVVDVVIHATGAFITSAIAHHIYVQRDFVERGDPAISWISVSFLLLLPEVQSVWQAVQSWGALLLMMASLDHAMRIHRQTSTSSINFRAGTLAAFCVILEPLNAGILLALILVQLAARAISFREWAMLLAGTVWAAMIALWVESYTPLSITQFLTIQNAESGWETSGAFRIAGWLGMVWVTAWGFALGVRGNSSIGLRSKSTRLHLLISWAAVVATGIGLLTWKAGAFDAESMLRHPHFAKLLAIACAFGTVCIVPSLWKRHRKPSIWHLVRITVLLGTIGLLFIAFI